jgi:hypothetical protein
MFIACIGYVSYGVFPWIPLHSVIADIVDNGQPVPQNYSVEVLPYFEIWTRDSNDTRHRPNRRCNIPDGYILLHSAKREDLLSCIYTAR